MLASNVESRQRANGCPRRCAITHRAPSLHMEVACKQRRIHTSTMVLLFQTRLQARAPPCLHHVGLCCKQAAKRKRESQSAACRTSLQRRPPRRAVRHCTYVGGGSQPCKAGQPEPCLEVLGLRLHYRMDVPLFAVHWPNHTTENSPPRSPACRWQGGERRAHTALRRCTWRLLVSREGSTPQRWPFCSERVCKPGHRLVCTMSVSAASRAARSGCRDSRCWDSALERRGCLAFHHDAHAALRTPG